MVRGFHQEECRWLTIGIGGLISAEEQVHAKYPNCKIFGVEPGNHGNFTKVGQLLSVGVGIDDYDNSNGIKVISLPRILDEFVHSRLVHYLSIDIESYEMIVLRELIGNGKFASENIVFCQIDAELHNPKQGGQHPLAENINRVQWILDFLSESSPYIPIFTVSYQPANKVTFINIVNSECEKAFKFSSYLNKE
uniref:Methyltransferase FkbM domain-containing protein n=1 Tax=Panagrolaimus superbus TaxID=310955 RepID=A0A914YGY3_9BILA